MHFEDYEKLKQEAKIFYSSIGSVTCPVLNNEKIIFDERGTNHLMRKGITPRSIRDQIRRFRLLKYVFVVIKDKNSELIIRKEKTAIFWTLKKSVGDQVIKVVIREFHGEIKHFFSIMNE
jgi:hypothetical protein